MKIQIEQKPHFSRKPDETPNERSIPHILLNLAHSHFICNIL